MASAPVWLEHPSSLRHDTGAHPERAERMVAIDRELSARDWLGFERVTSPPVSRALLETVHPAQYVASIERVCAARDGARLRGVMSGRAVRAECVRRCVVE